MGRAEDAAVRLADGRVLILGGIRRPTFCHSMDCILPITASVEIYDPRTGKFSRNGSLAGPRAYFQALLLDDGRVLVAGGYLPNDNTRPQDIDITTLEIYDPARGKSVVVKQPKGLKLPARPTVVLLADGRALIVGGSYGDDSSPSNVTLIFDPASGRFSKGPLLATPREGATATLLSDGRVLVAGGSGLRWSDSNSAEVIKPLAPLSQSTLMSTGDRNLGFEPISSLLSDGRVLVTIGTPDDARLPGTPEVFDPGTGRFTMTGPLIAPSYDSTVIKIQDGRVVFFGGYGANAGTVEAFDPGSNTFQVIAKGFPEIGEFSATLLDDGRILIAGGSGSGDGVDDHLANDWAATWFLKP